MVTLTTGRGSKKRKWRLSEKEFEAFEIIFGQHEEIIDLSELDFSTIQLVQQGTPARRAS